MWDLAQSIQREKWAGSRASRSTRLAAGLGVGGVEVEAVGAGDEGEGFFEVGAEFVGRAGAAGVSAGDGEAAADGFAGVLEPDDVVALPAVEGDGEA